jgi:hypothetical protein
MKLQLTTENFSREQYANWKQLQLKVFQAKDISVDHRVKRFMDQHPDWTFNLQWANSDIQQYAQQQNIRVSNENFNFFFACDLEFGKTPWSELEQSLKDWYQQSTHGGYFAFQSYYINWQNDPAALRLDLDDHLETAVDQWIQQHLGISTYDNDSLNLTNPLNNRTATGELISGSDFMYTHGNIRIWLWK